MPRIQPRKPLRPLAFALLTLALSGCTPYHYYGQQSAAICNDPVVIGQ
jgi:hypothetical protein